MDKQGINLDQLLETFKQKLEERFLDLGVNYDHKKIIKANGIVTTDSHYNLTEVAQIAQETNSMLVVNSNKPDQLQQYADQIGIWDAQAEFHKYCQTQFGGHILEGINLLYQAQTGTLEERLVNASIEEREDIGKKLMQAEKNIQSEFVQRKLQKAQTDFYNQNKANIKESTLQRHALYDIIVEKEAQEIADTLNQNSGLKVGFNSGDGQDAYTTLRIASKLKDPSQIIDLNLYSGLIEVQNEAGHSINFMSTATSIRPSQYIQQILMERGDIGGLIAHMENPQDVQEAYNRIASGQHIQNNKYNNLEDSPVDILFTYGMPNPELLQLLQEKQPNLAMLSGSELIRDMGQLEKSIQETYIGNTNIQSSKVTYLAKDQNGQPLMGEIELQNKPSDSLKYDINELKQEIQQYISQAKHQLQQYQKAA